MLFRVREAAKACLFPVTAFASIAHERKPPEPGFGDYSRPQRGSQHRVRRPLGRGTGGRTPGDHRGGRPVGGPHGRDSEKAESGNPVVTHLAG